MAEAIAEAIAEIITGFTRKLNMSYTYTNADLSENVSDGKPKTRKEKLKAALDSTQRALNQLLSESNPRPAVVGILERTKMELLLSIAAEVS